MRDSLPRRRRLGDPFASPKKIGELLELLLDQLSAHLKPFMAAEQARRNNYEKLVQLLQRASNFVRTQSTSRDSRTGRFPTALLARVVAVMSDILTRESQGRISFRTFTDNNLRVLSCPDDIKRLLEAGRITLFEALQLKRLSAENLSVTKAEAQALREEFLARCRRERWIAHRLRNEIDIKLGKRSLSVRAEPALAVSMAALPAYDLDDEFRSEFSPTPGSLFTEQLYLMMEVLQSINPSEVDGPELERLLNSVDDVLLQLQRIQRKQQKSAPASTRTRNLGFM